MSGFTIRRFTLQNIAAVATHCPIPGISQAALSITYGPAAVKAAAHAAAGGNGRAAAAALSAKGALYSRMLSLLVGSPSAGSQAPAGGFGLVTEEEMLWIQKRRREDAEESRVVLASRPTRNLLKGVGGGVLNLTLGCLLSPLIFLTITLEKVRVSRSPLVGLLVGPLYGATWAGIFLLTAIYAAAQQTMLSFYFSCVAAPTYYLINRPAPRNGASDESGGANAWFWSPLLCRFAVARGNPGDSEPLLFCYDENEVLRERAMKRLAVRGRKDKSNARYERKKAKAGQPADAEDYYGLLGVDRNASEREIKAAYNKLVLKIHPDKNPAPGAAAHFDNVTKAYRVLSNAEKRRKFDLGGAKGVEDLGVKKREGVRALFGGETLAKLSGDVFMGSFSQRVIDGLDYTQEELAVLQQRGIDRCRDELLENYLSHYLDHYGRSTGGSSSGSNNNAAQSLNAWDGKMKVQLKKIVPTGLGKEVLYLLGAEYRRAVQYYDDATQTREDDKGPSPPEATSAAVVAAASLPTVVLRRGARYLKEVGPHRIRQKWNKMKYLAKVRSDTFKNSESMIDLAWHSSVEEIERNARAVALSILFDPNTPAEEVVRRRAALLALADVFQHYGQPYKGASKQTMDQLMNSLREYQQQKEREKNA